MKGKRNSVAAEASKASVVVQSAECYKCEVGPTVHVGRYVKLCRHRCTRGTASSEISGRDNKMCRPDNKMCRFDSGILSSDSACFDVGLCSGGPCAAGGERGGGPDGGCWLYWGSQGLGKPAVLGVARDVD